MAANDTTLDGAIPSELLGQAEALEASDDPGAKAAAAVYREAITGAFPLGELAQRALEAQLLA